MLYLLKTTDIMKKIFYLIAALFLGTAAVSCDKEEDGKSEDNSIIGEWSGTRDPGDKERVMVHMSIKADGKLVLVMPAWIERRIGTYTVKGNKFSYKIDKLEWIVDRRNGYRNVYDQYGCWFKNSDFELPDDQREKFDNPHAQWAAGWPEDASGEKEFSIDKDGILSFKEGVFGLDLVFFKDPNFDEQKAIEPHLANSFI